MMVNESFNEYQWIVSVFI